MDAVSRRCQKIVGKAIFAGEGAGAGGGEFDDDLGAAADAIARKGVSGMRMSDSADEGEAESVTLRVAAFDEALQDAREKIGGEAGAVIFDGDGGGGLAG